MYKESIARGPLDGRPIFDINRGSLMAGQVGSRLHVLPMHPEDAPHVNQDAIDVVAADLLEDIDI